VTGGDIDLTIPPEPVDLRARARAQAEQAPERGLATVVEGRWIADPLWEAWGPELERGGLDRSRFGEIVTGYGRELWLWVMGERTWSQCASGLAGRVRRRLPIARAAPAQPARRPIDPR
jgi:hypothetical protein